MTSIRIEIDTVEQNDFLTDLDQIAHMQVAMTLAEEPVAPPPDEPVTARHEFGDLRLLECFPQDDIFRIHQTFANFLKIFRHQF